MMALWYRGALFFALLTVFSSCQAREVPADWKSECIGYFQIGLPGNVQMAVSSKKRLMSGENLKQASFADGTFSILSGLSYKNSRIRIFRPFSHDEFGQLKFFLEKRKKTDSLDFLSPAEHSTRIDSNKYELPSRESFGWVWDAADDGGGNVFVRKHEILYAYDYSTDLKGNANVELARGKIESVAYRKTFDVPAESGLCVPFGFIEDDGKQRRIIGVGLRIVDHPDVEIFFMDESAVPLGLKHSDNESDIDRLRYLWERTKWSVGKLELLGARDFPAVTVAGRKGRSSFVEMRRVKREGDDDIIPFDPKDQCTNPAAKYLMAPKDFAECPRVAPKPDTVVDYGYMAYVKGDARAKEDTPNLLLYVMRNSYKAKDGEPAMPKDEFKRLAETIAASIKRR